MSYLQTIRRLPLPCMYDSYNYNLPLIIYALELCYKTYKAHSNYPKYPRLLSDDGLQNNCPHCKNCLS